jgi:hypothetical protein
MGAWKTVRTLAATDLSNTYIKVNGIWKLADDVYIKVNGVWKIASVYYKQHVANADQNTGEWKQ